MKLSNFQFDLPNELLAEYPAENRDESRLMLLNRSKKTIDHLTFKDLIQFFEEMRGHSGQKSQKHYTSFLRPENCSSKREQIFPKNKINQY